MKVEETVIKWSEAINEVTIGATSADGGTRGKTVTVGGAKCAPCLGYEGPLGNPPATAVEIWDSGAADAWPAPIIEAYGDVVGNPAAWAKKAADFGADMICLRLMGTHPATQDTGPDEAAAVVKSVLEAVDLPLIVWGCDVEDKDNAVLPVCGQAAKGENCLMGSIKEKNYRTLVASCLADGHKLIAESPLDINIAKQLNILAHDVGYPLENLVVFPTTAALGTGHEYVYSIMERGRLAALGGDPLLRQPMICDVGSQAWRAKEAVGTDEALPGCGPAAVRGPLWEAITATNYLQSGGDLFVMRHPESLKILREAIDRLTQSAA